MKALDRGLHVVIALQNCLILWDIFLRQAPVSWTKVVLVFGSVLVLLVISLIQNKTARLESASVKHQGPSLETLSAPPKGAQEFARNRLNELFIRGEYLASSKPSKEDGDKLAKFWNEQVNQWMNGVGMLLERYWTPQEKKFFLSLSGESPFKFGIGVHDSSAHLYNDLLRYIRNLDTLRQQLSHG